MQRSRRRVLGLVGTLGVSALAGCNDSTINTDDESDNPSAGTRTPTLTTTPNEKTTEAQSEQTESDAPASLDPTFQTKIVPDVEVRSGDNQLFGTSVAVSNGIILIGFPEGPNGNSLPGGNVYVFDKSDGVLNRQAILTTDDAKSFGFSVALSEDASIALIGAFESPILRSGKPNVLGAGAAYVFQRSGDSWSQQAKIVPDDRDKNAGFGVSVALTDDANTALIGAYRDIPNGSQGGSAYVFDRAGSEWTQQAKLAADDGDSDDWFGVSVSVSDDLALVGASQDEDPNGEYGGSVYVFERSGNKWLQRSKITPNDGGKKFGEALALKGETAFIGAPAAGVYIFERGDGRWSRQTKLTGKAKEGFGKSIDLANNLAIFGAFADNQWTGSAYVYQRTEEAWTQEAKIAANDGDSEDWFGRAVAIDSSTAIVGANHDEDPNGRRGGSVYVFSL